MTDDNTRQAGTKNGNGLIIPPGIKEKHGDLIDLIIGSESMNSEERQYWINILPIMTPDQITNLHDILINERDQLKAIDQKYAKEIEQIGHKQMIAKTEHERRKKRSTRLDNEKEVEKNEEIIANELLKQIEAS